MNGSHVTQSTLGKWFQLSSIKVGRIQTAHGLKDRNGPTERAVFGGYVKGGTTKDGFPPWTWNAVRASMLIDESGEESRLDEMVLQVERLLAEAGHQRSIGCNFIADQIADRAFDGIPPELVGLIESGVKNPGPV